MFRIGTKPAESGPPRRSKSSSSTNRKSLPGPEPEEVDRPPALNNNANTVSAPQLDYRQNFVMSKSRSGDLATLSSHHQLQQQQQQQQLHQQQQQRQHHHQKRQAPPPPPFLGGQLRGAAPSMHPHQQVRKPGEMYAYEYFPSAMMRPGSRVGIADPAQLSTESADYDVIQRLQHRQPSSSDPPMRHPRDFNPGYDLYGSQRSYSGHHHAPQVHGVHLGSHGLAQVHMRTGSNLSSGSSSHNNLNTSGGSSGSGKASRPKSNFYEYEMFNPHNHFHYPSQQQQQQTLYSRGNHVYHQHN
jgi:hypothetical protein